MKKKYFGIRFWVNIILSAVILTASFCVYFFEDEIERNMNDGVYQDIINSPFKMFTIDVGQGDSLFFEFDNGENMLIDCGKYVTPTAVDNLLNSRDVETINYLVYTHSDKDHVGGGEYIFENYNVEVLYRPTLYSKNEIQDDGNCELHTTDVYENSIMPAYEESGCDIRYSFKGENFEIGDCSIEFLSPSQNSYSNKNDYSAVIMMEIYGRKILLTGDAESKIEEELVASFDIDADVLKVGHHGSNSSSSREFLEEVSPEIALISAGEGYEHPDEDVLERLENALVGEIYQTKEVETILLGIDEKGDINVYFSSLIIDFDMPLFLVSVGVLLMLIWGINITISKKQKKNE